MLLWNRRNELMKMLALRQAQGGAETRNCSDFANTAYSCNTMTEQNREMSVADLFLSLSKGRIIIVAIDFKRTIWDNDTYSLDVHKAQFRIIMSL
jgi:hypothetical protein